MKQIECPHEAAVTKALRSGALDESLAAHAATCAVCQDIVQASNWMQTMARGSGSNRALPDASLVWWKTQLFEQQARIEKAQSIVEWVEIAFTSVVSLGLAAWVAWNWDAIQVRLVGMLASAQLIVAAYSTSTLFLPIVAILCLTALLVAYPLITDV